MQLAQLSPGLACISSHQPETCKTEMPADQHCATVLPSSNPHAEHEDYDLSTSKQISFVPANEFCEYS
jgi:hypothetical protein